MHKLAKGLKKKKKQKKGKKGTEEDEFNAEELERYRRERAEAQEKLSEEQSETNASASDEWKKFEALTAGVDSILKKSQGDLDRIKSTSFFQRKAPPEEKKPKNKESEENKNQSKKWVGFDKDGNPIEESQEDKTSKEALAVDEDGFVNVPDDEDEQEDSSEEDIFDTTYIDVLQNTDVQLAYIPESPTEEDAGDDPFDTTNADKVLKTVDKKGKKLVSLGNAVEVLSGRIDYVSTCKLQSAEPRKTQDLLLDDDVIPEPDKVLGSTSDVLEVNKTLLDDDSDVQDLPVDITKIPAIVPIVCSSENKAVNANNKTEIPLDISEFEILKESTILEEIPDLDDSEFDLNAASDEVIILQEAEDPFSSKELASAEFQDEIVEASFEVATFVNEEDPFDTAFADNILPGKTELKFIEKELEELPQSLVSISFTDATGHNRNHESLNSNTVTYLNNSLESTRNNLLDSSTTDLNQLADQPILPSEELTYVDPFDTSSVQELPPGKTELKFLEKELLGEDTNAHESLDDDDFDPRKDENSIEVLSHPTIIETSQTIIHKISEVNQVDENFEVLGHIRKTSRPEVLEVTQHKAVAFELPTPSSRPDLLSTSKEEKVLHSKPLTPYYCQKSFEETFESEPVQEVDPFDTSFVVKVAPSKIELKLIESELLEAGTQSNNTNQRSAEKEQVLSQYTKQVPVTKTPVIEKQESILDSEITVDIKPLTPSVNTKTEEEEILYSDPFDTSIASSILPGKAELKLLENELSQVSEQVQNRFIPLNLAQVTNSTILDASNKNSNFNATKESTDFLCSDANDSGDKVLTPLQENQLFTEEEEIDPFDTSFASVGLGKTEIKLLESELINK